MSEVFISIPFKEKFSAVSNIIIQVAQKLNLSSFRADDNLIAVPLADEIHKRISECRVLVADVSETNANVYHEVGFAQASGKTIILLTHDEPTLAAFNIRGLRMIQYKFENLKMLAEILEKAFVEFSSPNEMLRAMLVPGSLGRPTKESRFVVATSPLSYRRAMGRTGGYSRLRRTSSDYVGLRGILQGFGLLYDFDALPDIADTEDYKDAVLFSDMTLYCIASPKANRWTQILLHEFANKWTPSLHFRPDVKSKDLRNITVSIFYDDSLLHPPGWDFKSELDRYQRDFGLIVRGPNPNNVEQMITILAGRSSLGTQAACHAFVSPKIIGEIRDRLRGCQIDIENHKQPFWAMVSLHRTLGDGLEEAIMDTLRVERVEPFKKKNI